MQRFFNYIYGLKGLRPKTKGHTNLYEHCDLTKKFIYYWAHLLLPDILHPLICHRHVFSEISKTFNCRFVPMFLYWLLLMMMPALLFKAHLLGEGELSKIQTPKKLCISSSSICKRLITINSSCSRNLKHFGNPKNENLLRSPKFYGENEFLVEMCISQLITEILSFFCFHKNFMTNLSFKIVKKLSRVQLFWR